MTFRTDDHGIITGVGWGFRLINPHKQIIAVGVAAKFLGNQMGKQPDPGHPGQTLPRVPDVARVARLTGASVDEYRWQSGSLPADSALPLEMCVKVGML
jgi:hypothetical protein